MDRILIDGLWGIAYCGALGLIFGMLGYIADKLEQWNETNHTDH